MSSRNSKHKRKDRPRRRAVARRRRRRASVRRLRHDKPSARRRRERIAARRRRGGDRVAVADRRRARELMAAPSVLLGPRVLVAERWRVDPQVGVMVTVNDEAGPLHGWAGWEVRLDELAAGDGPPPWAADLDGEEVPS